MNDFRKLSFINTMKKKSQVFEEESVINKSKLHSSPIKDAYTSLPSYVKIYILLPHIQNILENFHSPPLRKA